MSRLNPTGVILMLAGLQVVYLIALSESFYPGYSLTKNFISDLGVGPWPSSGIFTLTILLFGSMSLFAAWQLRQIRYSKLWIFLAISGTGAVGAAIFNENTGIPHSISAVLALTFLNLAAVYSYRVTTRPFSIIALSLGGIGLLSWALTPLGVSLGLGLGGMERLVFYPGILWSFCFGTYILRESNFH